MASVGVAIPTFRHAAFVRLTLESVLGQSRPPDRIVVVDDDSDDGTADIVAGFEGVTLIRHHRNRGPTCTTADAIDACGTDFVAVHDGDDVMRVGRIQAQLDAFADDPSLVVVGSLAQPIDTEGVPIGGPMGQPGTFTARAWAEDGMLAGGSTLMVRSPFRSHDRRLTWASDWKFVLDNLHGGGRSRVLDEVLVDYRRHRSSVSTGHRTDGLRDHVLMCGLLLDEWEDPEVRGALRAQRALKRCQLGEAQLASGSARSAAWAFSRAMVESRGRLARSVAASIRDGWRLHRAR